MWPAAVADRPARPLHCLCACGSVCFLTPFVPRALALAPTDRESAGRCLVPLAITKTYPVAPCTRWWLEAWRQGLDPNRNHFGIFFHLKFSDSSCALPFPRSTLCEATARLFPAMATASFRVEKGAYNGLFDDPPEMYFSLFFSFSFPLPFCVVLFCRYLLFQCGRVAASNHRLFLDHLIS